jgi:hypothetical protein
MKFILWNNGKESTPYDAAALERLISRGEVNPKCLARLESGKDWKPLELLIKKDAPAPAQSPPQPPSQPQPVVQPTRPVNKNARTLSYVLASLGLCFLAFGCYKRSAPQGSVEQLTQEFAEKDLVRANEAKNFARFSVASGQLDELRGSSGDALAAMTDAQALLEKAQEYIESGERKNAEADRMKRSREQTMILSSAAGFVLLLAGLILRAFS